MSFNSSSICLFCEMRLLLRPAQGLPKSSRWQQQTRCASQMQRKAPSRMKLSERVAQPSIERKKPQDPFGHLNKTSAEGLRRPDPTRRSTAEMRRVTGGRSFKNEKGKPTEQYKALKMQRTLNPMAYGQRNAIKGRIADIDSFEQFDLLPGIQESIQTQALAGMTDISPTPVQRVALPALLGMEGDKKRLRGPKKDPKDVEQFLLAAETGSGKTLAYLLPVMDAMKRAEMEEIAERQIEEEAEALKPKRELGPYEVEAPVVQEREVTPARPKVIVLVPSAELVAQVASLAKSFCHTVKFKVAAISTAYSTTVIRNRLFSPSGVDMVISTPHLLSSIAESDPNILSRVTHLVADEADSLFDRSFAPITSSVVDRAMPSLRQLILCSATIPRTLDSFLRKRYPDINRLVTPNLHAIPRRVQLGVVDVEKDPYRGNKSLACADTIWNIGRAAAEYADQEKEEYQTKRIIVFVNEREKAVEVADFLDKKGIDAHALTRDTADVRQEQILATFKGIVSPPPSKSPKARGKEQEVTTPIKPIGSGRRLGNTKVLVTTDLGSRGIDTLAVRHVILYDVPHTTIDFIHRLGRTGRMGRRGRGIVLVGKGDRKDVVKEVREGMYKGQALI